MERFITAARCAVRISDSGLDRIEEQQEGARPVLVLLHGYLESLDVWSEFSKLLTPHMRVVAIDLPGHGISQVKGEVHSMEFLADVVSSALGAMDIERCFLLGHSMGGYVALEFMRKYPNQLNGVILLHSTPNSDSPEKQEQRLKEIEIIRSGKKELLAPTVSHRFADVNLKRFANQIEEQMEQAIITEDDGAVAILHGMRERKDLNEAMRTSKVPQMIILGRMDNHIPAEVAQKLIDQQPQARIVWLEESGHMGFVEQPKEAAQAILDFCV